MDVTRFRRWAVRALPHRVRRLLRAILRGSAETAVPVARPMPSPRVDAKAELFDQLSKGKPLPDAAVAAVRRLAKASALDAAVSFSAALAADSDVTTRTAGLLAGGVTASLRRLPVLALDFFDRVDDEHWRTHALDEYLEAIYRNRPEELQALLAGLLDPAAALGPNQMTSVIKFAIVVGDLDLATRGFQRLEQQLATNPNAWRNTSREITWLRPWMTSRKAPDVAADVIPFALIDYRQPGRTKSSKNIGDFIQTLASLGHLARHQNVCFDGDPELARFATELQGRVRADRRIISRYRTVSLVAANRDATSMEDFPEATWTLAFGWYMHPLFGIRYDFPFHPNLRPIFISFHCNKREILTPKAIAYLRRYGPIGCRDWTTVDLLLSVGVPAFFSGCLTTTVDTLFPARTRIKTRGTVYVDVPLAPSDAAVVHHSYPEVKDRTFVENLREALRLLDWYQTVQRIVTSRLHCYLPVQSIGVDIEFQPKRPADVRFNGVVGNDDASFAAMRQRILDRLSTVVHAILDGYSEEEVYLLWRDACADDVAAAQTRHAKVGPVVQSRLNLPAIVRDVLDRATTIGPEPLEGSVNVVLAVDAAGVQYAVRTLRSLVREASRPVHAWMLARARPSQDRLHLAQQIPEVSVTWLSTGRHPRAVGQLLLPHLLSDVRRAVIVPGGAVVNADIAELAELDLKGRSLAARSALGGSRTSGFGLLYRAAAKMGATAAHDFYRMIHSRHAFDFDAFDTNVMVLDLAQLRKDDVAEEFLPLVESYGFSWSTVLNLYAGPNRAPLPEDWAHNPANEWPRNAKLVHWSGGPKPWESAYAPGKYLWEVEA